MMETERKSTIPETDWLWIPVEKLTNPVHFRMVEFHENSWYAVHPEKGVAFYNPLKRHTQLRSRRYGAPQCNTNEAIVRRLLYAKPPGCEVVFIKHAWLPIDPHEWVGG